MKNKKAEETGNNMHSQDVGDKKSQSKQAGSDNKSPGDNKSRIIKADFRENPLIATLILFIIVSVVTLALAGANELTKDQIIAQAKIDQDNARIEVFPGAVSFEDLSADFVTKETPKIKSVFKVLDGGNKIIGIIIISASRGYAGDVQIMSGISLDKKLYGIKVLADNETPGLGKKVKETAFTSRFINKKPGLLFSLNKIDKDVNYIDAVTGATISSRAMVDASNAALSFATTVYSKLKSGGELNVT